MLSIELRSDLADELQAKAARQQTTVQELVNEWLAQDLWEQRNEKIRQEAEIYRSQHAVLRERYAEKFIAMRGGEIVESGDEPVLITQVLEDPVDIYTIRSPRLVTE